MLIILSKRIHINYFNTFTIKITINIFNKKSPFFNSIPETLDIRPFELVFIQLKTGSFKFFGHTFIRLDKEILSILKNIGLSSFVFFSKPNLKFEFLSGNDVKISNFSLE